ncbi:MAG: hypothetical protein GWN99_08455, partial [Gemmatimonadetes bacterium]|nr:hypothetical protein [Gemmatimonadota bacterium]NIS01084.1 hypothetical protein [Gemmatimonadota bacterium]NIT66841.1 hypothetical protein [Gemmatimonadota bacterium]NIU53406.1 hypothetical protein [Gemmatimonadota bacterium]NIV23441.1 hypothetical protein [Gemmatimonadota bacterium]
ILEETWRFIVRLGFAPSLDPCSRCGRSPDLDERTHFDLAGGGVICDGCRRQDAGLSLKTLPPLARAELALLVAGAAEGTVLKTVRSQRHL